MVRQLHLRNALELAVEVMEKNDYTPTEKENGTVKWQKERADPNHLCIILFRSFISALNNGFPQQGYIIAQSCECREIPFDNIVVNFRDELRKRGWLGSDREGYRLPSSARPRKCRFS